MRHPRPARTALFALFFPALVAASAPLADGSHGASPAARSGSGSASGSTAGSAALRRMWLERFHSDIRVYDTGVVEVTETFRARFEGSWNGIYREIPVRYDAPGLGDFELRVEVTEVTAGAGEPLRHESSREGRNLRIKVWVPGAADAARTVVIRYRVENALVFHEEGEEGFQGRAFDELYWNATGTEWPFRIERASATVHLPVEASGVETRGWTGAYGATERDVEIDRRGPVVEFRVPTPLDAREGLTIAVGWEAGVVQRPSALDRTRELLLAFWPLGLPLLFLVGMYRHWSDRGKDPDRRSVAPRYEPPDGLRPGGVGVLVDHVPNLHDVTATLVDLAVRGHLVIEEREESKLLGLTSDRHYAFERRTGPEEWKELHGYERRLLSSLFGGGSRRKVELADLEDEFYRKLPGIRNALFDRLVELGYYRERPDHVRGRYFVAAAVVVALAFAAGIFLQRSFLVSLPTMLLGGGLSAAVVAGFGWFMPARTPAGARALEQALGFEEFLERVEEDRFRRMIRGPEDFERYLPYAMALQVEKKWAKAFEDLYTEPPDWYRGSHAGGFRPTLFAHSLGDLSTRTASAMSSSPRSSGGSGFGGGGGFSGGGVGGGGGGGF